MSMNGKTCFKSVSKQNYQLVILIIFLFLNVSSLHPQTWSGRDEDGNKIPGVISVGELIYSKCTPCHRPNGAAEDEPHFTTKLQCDTYGYLMPWHLTPLTNHHLMPKWKPDPTYSNFIGERVLTQAEINAITTWAGLGQGVQKNGYEPYPIPPYYVPTPQTQLQAINLTNSIPNYTPQIVNGHDYQNFSLSNFSSSDVFISKVEFLIDEDNGPTIHHILLCKDDSPVQSTYPQQRTIQMQDAYSDVGYDSEDFGISAGQVSDQAFSIIATWTPSEGIFSLPCNFGIKLKAGQRLVVQMHYTDDSDPDNTVINIQYSTANPTREVFSNYIVGDFTNAAGTPIHLINPYPLQSDGLDIGGNSTKTVYRNDLVPQNPSSPTNAISVIGVLPHMHLRGRTFELYASTAISGQPKTNLIKINSWDFSWQEMYYFRQPVKVAYGNNFYMQALYDNTTNNPNFDDPPYQNTWQQSTEQGLSTTQEMLVIVMLWTPYVAGDESIMLDPKHPNYIQANAGLDNFICSSSSPIQLGAAPVSGVTYSWTPTSGLSSSTIANPTTIQAATYKLTTTKTGTGCTATSSVTVAGISTTCQASTIKNLAGQDRTLNYISNTNLSTIRNDVNGVGGSNEIDLSKVGYDVIVKFDNNSSSTITLTVDGNYTIKNSLNTTNAFDKSGGFRFGQNDRIVIPNGSSLTIDNSYFSACGANMWTGIVVNPGGTLITKNLSVIADAQTAIVYGSGGIGNFDVSNTRFYRNMTSIYTSGSVSSTSKINGSHFKYDATQPLMNFMLYPKCGERPYHGIYMDGHTGTTWNLSDQANDKPNTFDGLNSGLYLLTSNVRVNNNNFNNILNYNNVAVAAGKAIYSQSTAGSAGNLIFVQTNTNTSAAAFNNCDYGVYVNNANATVLYNKMTNVKNGIYATNNSTRSNLLSTNVITHTNAGITLNIANSASFLIKSVYDNDISVNAPTTLIPTTYGIGHLEASATTASYRPKIELNSISGGRYGIYLNNAYGTHVTNNTCTTSTASSTGIFAGIYASGSKASLITLNTITGNGTTYDELSGSTAFRKNGIYFSATTDAELCNNTFNNIGYASQFLATCSNTKLKQNTINGCKYGVVLKNNGATQGVISGQGTASLRHGNTFTGPFNNTDCSGAACRTYCFNSDGTNSPFRVLVPATDQPHPNGTNSGLSPIIKLQSSTSTSWSCAAFKTLDVSEGDMSDLYTEEIAEGDAAQYMEYGFEESGSWFVEKDLYERLKEDEVMLQSELLFQDFYETKEQESIGRISQYDEAALLITDSSLVTDSASLADLLQNALAANHQIPGMEVYEQNQKWVNEVYLNTVAKGIIEFTASERQSLFELASKCPYAEGDAVYSARTLYSLVDNTAYFDDEQICNALAANKKEKAAKGELDMSITIRPNPATDIVDIIIKRSEEALKMEVFNPLGQLIGSAFVNNYVELNVTRWEKGAYLVRFSDSTGARHHSRLIVF